jgi:hypothetical protein
MILNIVMPVSRPENIGIIGDSIQKAIDIANHKEAECVVRWYLIFDFAKLPEFSLGAFDGTAFTALHKAGNWGNPQRNVALSDIREGWVCFLDDDTIMPEMFIYWLDTEISNNPEKRAFVFDQVKADGTVLYAACHENMCVDHVGGPQVVFERSLIGAHRWKPLPYNSDGYFVEEIYRENKDAFCMANGFIYCNYLRPESCK